MAKSLYKIGYVFIIVAIIVVGVVLYLNSQYHGITRIFSPYSVLRSSWEKYKKQFINQDGRVIDYGQNSVTTSEGQSYALLRAVWIDDKDAFDLIWKWTKSTLKRPNDNLFGWRWGKNADEHYGFLTDGGDNSAADADSDIALALIFAGSRWQNSDYTNEAQKILADMWRKETGVVNGKRYVVAGNWAVSSKELVINPSYFEPYAWRIFAKVDTKHDWKSLIEPGYDLLNKVGKAPLDKTKGVGLPPDWVAINASTGELKAPEIPNISTNYSFDAIRIPWRIALDYQWNNDQLAYKYLENFRLLENEFQKNNQLAAAYTHDGQILNANENPSTYATILGYFMIYNPQIAGDIYQNKIIKLYSNPDSTFNQDLPYYEQNWLWFGTGLYNKLLKPLI